MLFSIYKSFLHTFLFLLITHGIAFSQISSNSKNKNVYLKSYLQDLETEQNIHVYYESSILDEIIINTNPDSLPVDPYEALSHILKNTKLFVKKISDNAYVIKSKLKVGFIYGSILGENGIGLPGATVIAEETEKGNAANINGEYELAIKPGKWLITCSYVGMVEKQKSISIVSGDSIRLDFVLEDQASMQEIVVVGRSPLNSVFEVASPTTVVNFKEEEQKTYYGLSELLQNTIPSFHSTNQTIADATDHIDPVTLKGLGSDQLLVLVNGKRRHHSALVNVNGSLGRGSVATDLNAIPTSAIERVEIIRDGASVYYGSDAISGVLNVILKKNTNYTDIKLKSGISQAGDGLLTNLSANTGFSFNSDGVLNLSIDYNKRNEINRSGAYTGIIYGDDRDNDKKKTDAFFKQTGFKDNRVINAGRASTDNLSVFLNSEFKISPKFLFYGFGGMNFRFAKSSGFYRFPYQVAKQSGLYDYGFLPKLKSNIQDQSMTLGVKGKRNKWNLDISNTTGRNRILMNVVDSNNASLGPASPSSAVVGGFNYLQNISNFDFSRNLESYPLAISFGLEFRTELFNQMDGEEVSWQDYGFVDLEGVRKEPAIQMFPGFRPENSLDRLRYNTGMYLNLESDLTKNIKIGAANRYEYYQDFGGNLSLKLYSRFKLTSTQSIKGSVNTGFRAPSLPQIYYNSISTQFVSDGPQEKSVFVGSFNSESPVRAKFGIDPLIAETSMNINLGYNFNPNDNFSLAFDVYNIDIKDRIVLSGRFNSADDPLFKALLKPFKIEEAQFFTNAIDTRTQGADIELEYVYNFKGFKSKFSSLVNISKTSLMKDEDGKRIIKTSEKLKGFENVLFGREDIGRIENSQPSSKIIFNLNLEKSKYVINLNLVRYGDISYFHPEDYKEEDYVLNSFSGKYESRDQIFSSKWISSMQLGCDLEDFAISVGVNNLFNIFPDQHSHSSNTSNGIFPYSRRVQQFGLTGAFWYSTVSFKL